MAELVIGPLVSMVKEKVSSYLLDQYKVMEGMEKQRKILERKLPAILDIIEDAEVKGAFRPGVRAWLKDLKTVAYEANDVFDEFKYEALRREAKKKGQYNMLGIDAVSLLPAHNSIVFRCRMGKKLQIIVQTIEVLVTEMNAFGFRHLEQAPASNKQWRKTDSIMVDSDKTIVSRSRDDEMKKIVRILTHEASNMDLMVLPIVGMGGLGKTTFVQLIYNDAAIENHFELRRWCCVSNDFDVGNIANTICTSTEKDREKALQDLQKEIGGKRYLIVLDDVWNRDVDKWGKLRTCLKQGGKGSAVLTTTRDDEVARIMTVGSEAYHLDTLGDQYMKEIIQTRAFTFQRPISEELDDILDKIVHRCAGCPLAAKAFGSMLSNKTTLNEWKDILARSNICSEGNENFPVLKLSYDDLPSHMKQCFAFCAIFPKDYEIDVNHLIHLWMAHDFIPLEEKDHHETVGEEIFRELSWRSFFQEVKQSPLTEHEKWNDMLCSRTTCKIHDLMHDIALSVMGKDCLTVTDRPNDKKFLPDPIRHFFLSCRAGTLLDGFLKKQSPTLQTLFCTDGDHLSHMLEYNSLRALHLPWTSRYQFRARHLQWQHLRYLNLSHNKVITELPLEVSMLYNLQTLNISGCSGLRQLPKQLKYMTRLRHLYTHGCRSLTHMPLDVGNLTSLQTLTYFVVGTSFNCSTVGELQNLNLGGQLVVHGLQNVAESHAKVANLRKKQNLTHLSLKWNSDANEVQDCHMKVLDALKPHGGLEMLSLDSYKGSSLPSWMIDLTMLQQLTELHLIDCTVCEVFPQFFHLKALQVLYLEKLDKLRSLCSNTESMTFPALKELKLHDLKSLERWVATEGKELTFPVLENVYIRSCPKLTSLPEAPKLKVIKVNEGKAHLSLEIVKARYMSLLSKATLSVQDREAPVRQDSENNYESPLTELTLDGCNFFFPSSSSQTTIGLWKCFGKLVDLEIENCNELIHWPEEVFQKLLSLKNMDIRRCKKLIGPTKLNGEPMPTPDPVLPHINRIRISHCGSLVELFILPPSLISISIGLCDKLEQIWGEEGYQSGTCTSVGPPWDGHASTSVVEQSSAQAKHPPPCLEDLFIYGCGILVALPNLPSSLRSLEIESCQELCSVSGQLGALSPCSFRWQIPQILQILAD